MRDFTKLLKNKFKSKKYFKKHSRLGYLPVVQRTGSLAEFGGNNTSGDFPESPSLSQDELIYSVGHLDPSKMSEKGKGVENQICR